MRRAQAALEFITTYGWAILVVLLMAGTFAYFGILNPNKLAPERCSTEPEFSCSDYRLSTDTAKNITLMFKQGIGQTIYVINASCIYQGAQTYGSDFRQVVGTDKNAYAVYPYTWQPRDQFQFTCNNRLPASLKGQKVKVSFIINYKTNVNGLEHDTTGDVFAEVQG
jgi:hypothetical protein